MPLVSYLCFFYAMQAAHCLGLPSYFCLTNIFLLLYFHRYGSSFIAVCLYFPILLCSFAFICHAVRYLISHCPVCRSSVLLAGHFAANLTLLFILILLRLVLSFLSCLPLVTVIGLSTKHYTNTNTTLLVLIHPCLVTLLPLLS